MRWRIALLATLWVAPAASQQPNFHIGNSFYKLCATAHEGPTFVSCFAYVQGAHDMLNWQRRPPLCYPPITMREIYDLLLQELAPDDWRKRSLPTVGVLETMLSEKFKCP